MNQWHQNSVAGAASPCMYHAALALECLHWHGHLQTKTRHIYNKTNCKQR